jgi:hypothetical protein
VPEPKVEAPDPKVEPAAAAEPESQPEPGAAPTTNAKAEPVYMPASKSGGDFGAMQFPGQGQINPAPKLEPTQQQAAQE